MIGAGSGAAGTVTVNGTVSVNTIQFNAPGSGNYTVTGGTLSMAGSSPAIGFGVAGPSPTINSVIGEASPGTAVYFGNPSYRGTMTLNGTNTFSGTATLDEVTVYFNNLQNGGTASSFG